MNIIDSHTHLWDLTLNKNPWLISEINDNGFLGNYSQIRNSYGLANYFNDCKNFNVKKTVHIQAGWDEHDYLGETKWLAKINDQHHYPHAIIAYLDFSSKNTINQLENLMCYSHLVKGIRQITAWHDDALYRACDQDYLNNPTWIKQFNQLKDFNLSFDLQIYPEQADRAFDLLSKNQEIPVVIEHAMLPTNREEDYLQYWEKQLKKLSTLPNTFIKLSGLAMFDHHWTSKSFRRIFEPVVTLFTPSRCMIGSNFPVDKLYGSFNDIYQAYFDIASQYSATEQHALFYETANRFYQL